MDYVLSKINVMYNVDVILSSLKFYIPKLYRKTIGFGAESPRPVAGQAQAQDPAQLIEIGKIQV